MSLRRAAALARDLAVSRTVTCMISSTSSQELAIVNTADSGSQCHISTMSITLASVLPLPSTVGLHNGKTLPKVWAWLSVALTA